jgi:c(7)-type cytochrome triheme protein
MKSACKRTTRLAAVLAGALLATAGLAGELRRLPPDFALPSSDGSPGPVTFSHSSHVDAARPSCVTCHPKVFRILEKGATATGETVKHDSMEAGRACGACHGKTAFGFESCDLCHRS